MESEKFSVSNDVLPSQVMNKFKTYKVHFYTANISRENAEHMKRPCSIIMYQYM